MGFDNVLLARSINVCPLHFFPSFSYLFHILGNQIRGSKMICNGVMSKLIVDSHPKNWNYTCRPSLCMHSRDSCSSKSLRWFSAIWQGWLYFENLVWLCLFTMRMNEIMCERVCCLERVNGENARLNGVWEYCAWWHIMCATQVQKYKQRHHGTCIPLFEPYTAHKILRNTRWNVGSPMFFRQHNNIQEYSLDERILHCNYSMHPPTDI
jgi:hypothetical protein